jgi:hypothetical protein
MLKTDFLSRLTSKQLKNNDYSLVPDKISVLEKLNILCNVHNQVYRQKAQAHYLKGHGCPLCANEKKRTGYDKIIERFKKVQPSDRGLDYSLVPKDITNKSRIPVICPIHGVFYTTVGIQLTGCGCPKCEKERTNRLQKSSRDQIITRISPSFPDLSYNLLPEKFSLKEKITLVCKYHGPFEIVANNHVNNRQGCRFCANERLAITRRIGRDNFILRALKIHGTEHYEYSLIPASFKIADYLNIRCNVHNYVFSQTGASHLNGAGCPICGKSLSHKEFELFEVAKSVCSDTVSKYKGWCRNSREEIDIFVPSKRVGFEFNGLYWHSTRIVSGSGELIFVRHQNYHLNKQIHAKENGIDLFFLWEDSNFSDSISIVKDVLNGVYKASVVDGFIDKDVCPSSIYLPDKCTIIKELPPSEKIRILRKTQYSTFGTGYWKIYQ